MKRSYWLLSLLFVGAWSGCVDVAGFQCDPSVGCGNISFYCNRDTNTCVQCPPNVTVPGDVFDRCGSTVTDGGCLGTGEACTSNAFCCSGLCQTVTTGNEPAQTCH